MSFKRCQQSVKCDDLTYNNMIYHMAFVPVSLIKIT